MVKDLKTEKFKKKRIRDKEDKDTTICLSIQISGMKTKFAKVQIKMFLISVKSNLVLTMVFDT